MSKSIFIISFYNNRSPQNLEYLIKQLMIYGQEILVVVNIDNYNNLELERHKNLSFLKRVNEGMNIGAWNQGWRYFSDFDNYFFFQDECFLKNNNFFEDLIGLISIPPLLKNLPHTSKSTFGYLFRSFKYIFSIHCS